MLAEAVSVTGPSVWPPAYRSVTKPKPLVGVTVTHDGADDTVQAVFDGVLTRVEPPLAATVQLGTVVVIFGEPVAPAMPLVTQASMTST